MSHGIHVLAYEIMTLRAKLNINQYTLLPTEKTFRQLFIPFFAPYFLYVVIGALPAEWLSPDEKQLLKLIAVAAAMGYFLKWYHFGNLTGKTIVISIIAAPLAICLWVLPLYFMKGHAANYTSIFPFSESYFLMRFFNSVFLVAVFEELLIRVYLMQWFYQAGTQMNPKAFATVTLDTFDQYPNSLSALPLSLISVSITTLLFAAGHGLSEWVSAIFYFSVTSYIYKKTGSLWVCILIHGLTNLAIALLVRFGGMYYLWQ